VSQEKTRYEPTVLSAFSGDQNHTSSSNGKAIFRLSVSLINETITETLSRSSITRAQQALRSGEGDLMR
jgi:hypothetical protein